MAAQNKTELMSSHDLTSINQNLRSLHDYLDHLARAKMAGIDTSEHEQHHAALVDGWTRLKQAFFPGK